MKEQGPRIYFIDFGGGTKMTVGFSGPLAKEAEAAWVRRMQLYEDKVLKRERKPCKKVKVNIALT
jgi:hypothetical protein